MFSWHWSRDALGNSRRNNNSTKKKRKCWETDEVQAVERHMKIFIITCRVPGKTECESCIRAEPVALKDRNWQSVKFYVYNRIVAYKRETQFFLKNNFLIKLGFCLMFKTVQCFKLYTLKVKLQGVLQGSKTLQRSNRNW